jgi:hypothetical protein
MRLASLILAGFLCILTACSNLGRHSSAQAASGECHARVVLRIAPDAGAVSKPELLAAITHDTSIPLNLISEVSDVVLVVEMAGVGGSSCEAALATLRRDPRIRAADLDVRAKRHAS